MCTKWRSFCKSSPHRQLWLRSKKVKGNEKLLIYVYIFIFFFFFFLCYFDRAENHCKYPVLMLKSIMKYEKKNTSTNLVFVFKFQQRLKRTPLRFSTASEVRVFLIPFPFFVSDVAYVSFTVEGIFFTWMFFLTTRFILTIACRYVVV